MRDVLFNIFCIIISGCGIALAKYLCALINKKIDEAQKNIELDEGLKVDSYIDKAQDAIETAVLQTMQTYVDTLKKQNKFDKEAQEEAKNKALEIAKKLISEESKDAIILLYNDFDLYVEANLEKFVNTNKSTPENDGEKK